VPESLLTILKFCLLAVLYLFFVRVLRAVWSEVNAPPVPAMAPVAAPARALRSTAPRPGSAPGRFVVVEPTETKGQTFDLADELTLGRAGGCGIPLDDTYVSQLHARLFRQDGQIFVEDMGSTNGTFVNRKKVSAAVPLRRGDRLQVGRTVLELTK